MFQGLQLMKCIYFNEVVVIYPQNSWRALDLYDIEV